MKQDDNMHKTPKVEEKFRKEDIYGSEEIRKEELRKEELRKEDEFRESRNKNSGYQEKPRGENKEHEEEFRDNRNKNLGYQEKKLGENKEPVLGEVQKGLDSQNRNIVNEPRSDLGKHESTKKDTQVKDDKAIKK